MPRRALLAGWATVALSTTSKRVNAKQGDIPKFKGLGEITGDYIADPLDRRGESLYDEAARAELPQRTKKVTKEWKKLVKEVDAALGVERCSEAISALSLRMGT